MAKLTSILLVNYRRFHGEIELPLDPGVNLIAIPSGMGRSTLLEAISWCLLGNELVSDPGQVPNVDALGSGMAQVMVSLTFVNGESLERYALFSKEEEGTAQQGWGWRLRRSVDTSIVAEGDDTEEFMEHQERLFPEACVHANLIDGSDLMQIIHGRRSGPERAVQCSDNWCTSDLSLRCAKEATGLFHRLCPEGGVDALDYGPEGRLELTLSAPPSQSQARLALLSHALAFARENAPVCPVIMVDPLGESHDLMEQYRHILDLFPSRQLIFLLSDARDIHALRSTGRVDRELEIRG